MFIRSNDTPEKKKFREEGFPKKPFTETILMPFLRSMMQGVLIEMLRAEIEIYKAFPKNNAKPDLATFNPTNPKTCFMGMGFLQKSDQWQDADLEEYRQRIGTMHSKVWGDCTTLEIWAADHFVRHPEMVTGVFKYCYGMQKTLPNLYFESMPFMYNDLTGANTPDEDDREDALNEYLYNLNNVRESMGLKAVDHIEDKYMKDFERQWKEKNNMK